MKIAIFYTYVAKIGNSVLTKRSTPVDQNFRSCKGVSKLSLATFIAPQTHFWAQESLIYEKMSLKIAIFDPYGAQKGISVLTKRSTHVDQNLISWKVMSKLSVAIFIAPITHFWAQKSFVDLKNAYFWIFNFGKSHFLQVMWPKRATGCWPKGQQVLTKISDLEKWCLSSL